MRKEKVSCVICKKSLLTNNKFNVPVNISSLPLKIEKEYLTIKIRDLIVKTDSKEIYTSNICNNCLKIFLEEAIKKVSKLI
jgi:hypothetical protein